MIVTQRLLAPVLNADAASVITALIGMVNVLLVQVDLRQCHYLVDLDIEEETPLEPRYSAVKDEWSVIAYKPFLHASR